MTANISCAIVLICFASLSSATAETDHSASATADRLIERSNSLANRTIAKCIEPKPRLIAEAAERAQSAEKEVEAALGPAPFLPSLHSPQVKAVICDEKMPFENKIQILFDTGSGDTLLEYYTCLALARQDASACDPLRPVNIAMMHRKQGRRPPVETCQMNYHRFLWSKALIRDDPAADKICERLCTAYGSREVVEADGEVAGLPSCDKLCAIASRYKNDPDRFCAELESFSQSPALAQVCQEKRFAIRVGLGPCVGPDQAKELRDPDYLPCLPNNPSCVPFFPTRNHCLDTAALRTACKADNKEFCGDSSTCRALTGDGAAACHSYADLAVRRICGAEERFPEASRKRREWEDKRKSALDNKLSALRRQAARLGADCRRDFDRIAALDKKISLAIDQTEAGAPGRKAREEKLAAMTNRHSDLGRKFDSLEFPAALTGTDGR